MSSDLNALWLDRLKAVECPDATFRDQTKPLVLKDARGSWVRDVAGREYLDFCSGFGVMALGHNHPAIVQAISHSTDSTAYAPLVHGMGDVYATDAKIALLESIRGLMPAHLQRVSLGLTGAHAIEYAMKTAMLATGRSGFVVFQGGYHGLDLGTLPLTSREDFSAPFRGWLREGLIRRLPFAAPMAEVDAAVDDLKRSGSGCAAIVTEPIQGRAGVRVPPGGWLEGLREVSRAHGSLLIFDEIFSGLGRAGSITEAHRVAADIICLGKALGGGWPLSACVASEKVMAAWPESRGEALHTGTFFGHPFACRTALATLKQLVADDLVEHANRQGKVLMSAIAAGVARHPALKGMVSEIRGRGLMLGIEFNRDGLGAEAMTACRVQGLLALASGDRGQCLQLTPPLNLSREDLETGVQRLIQALAQLTSEGVTSGT